MKKIFLLTTLTTLFVACKKEGGNQGVIVKENVETSTTSKNGKIDSTTTINKTIVNGSERIQENTYRYVAEDGSNALVTFTKKNGAEDMISVKSNKKVITAKFTDADEKSVVYNNGDITIVSEGDLVKISQGENLIELKKAREQ